MFISFAANDRARYLRVGEMYINRDLPEAFHEGCTGEFGGKSGTLSSSR